MDVSQEVCIFLSSLSALAVLYTMNNVPAFQGPFVILEIGAVVLVLVFLLAFLSVRHRPPKDLLFYVCVEFSFTCIIDLTSALEYDGFISGFMDFYREAGEPYLGTAYGIMMCYWDGVVHFFLYLLMVRRMDIKKPYRSVGLFWAGSLSANMLVFVLGIVIGKYGAEIRPAFWLNMPFLLVPLWGAVTLFCRPRELPIISAITVEREHRKGLFSRPLDLLLFVLLLGIMGFTLFRGFVALGCPQEVCSTYVSRYEPYLKDPAGYPRVMMLLFLFYGLPQLTAFAYGLRTPGCTWMVDWTVFFAGAVSQWSHIGASLHPNTPSQFQTPGERWWPVMVLNLLYMAVPQVLALRCTHSPTFFMKKNAEDHANGASKFK
uniref:Transmembrane 6 superfamily member 2b n=1 Tax=Scleropages formosus TaxID=113540 RepID=A0A8C9R4F2_SCLFO